MSVVGLFPLGVLFFSCFLPVIVDYFPRSLLDIYWSPLGFFCICRSSTLCCFSNVCFMLFPGRRGSFISWLPAVASFGFRCFRRRFFLFRRRNYLRLLISSFLRLLFFDLILLLFALLCLLFPPVVFTYQCRILVGMFLWPPRFLLILALICFGFSRCAVSPMVV